MQSALAIATSALKPLKREFVIRLTPDARSVVDALAAQYNLTTADGLPRDAEIVRVLLCCALMEGRPPREQAAVALYVNGLMLVSQGLWFGLYDVRDDLAKIMNRVVGTNLPQRSEGEPGKKLDRMRVHLKVDDLIRDELTAVVAKNSNYVEADGSVLDTALVTTLVNAAAARPDMFTKPFALYAEGVSKIRLGLVAGMTTVRDTLREAVTIVAGGST